MGPRRSTARGEPLAGKNVKVRYALRPTLTEKARVSIQPIPRGSLLEKKRRKADLADGVDARIPICCVLSARRTEILARIVGPKLPLVRGVDQIKAEHSPI